MVRATHPTTIEVTKDPSLTSRGDCIIGIRASKAVLDLAPRMKRAISREATVMSITIEADGTWHRIRAKGDPRLTLRSSTDMVVRKSSFVCDRTLAVLADGAAVNLPKSMVERLRNPEALGRMTIEVE